MEKKNTIIYVVIIVIIVALIGVFATKKAPESQYDTSTLAQCLKDKGAIFYGAWWCQHCQATKALFGDGAANLPYVECSGSNPQEQLQVCKDKGIESYPTWFFADGTSLNGEQTLEALAEKTSCTLLPNPNLNK